jgi:hypothetical protein
MTRRAAQVVTGARPVTRPRAGPASRAPRGPDRRSDRVGAGAPHCHGETDPEAAGVRWRLTPQGEAFVASLRAAGAAGEARS